jgi:hypothetical protein
LDITWGIGTRNRRLKRYSENFHEFLRCSTKICFRTATSPNLTSLKLEVSLGTTTKYKGLGAVITVVITSKTQIKEKELKVKQWVISQECFSLTPLS